MSWRCVVAQPDQLGESPFWHPRGAAAVLGRHPGAADSPRRPRHRQRRELGHAVRAGLHRARRWRRPGDGACATASIAPRSWGGPLVPVVRFNHDVATTRFNDGKADPVGRFWAGTMYEPRDARKAELYSIDLRASNGNGGKPLVQLKAQQRHHCQRPGLVARCEHAVLGRHAQPRDPCLGLGGAGQCDEPPPRVPAVSRQARRLAAGPARLRRPARRRRGGHRRQLLVRDVRRRAVAEDSRRTGKLLAEFALPVRCPTMPCFGGDDLKTLYVTSARLHRPPEELQALPQSGCVIAMRVEVPGLPVNFVSD